MKNKILLVVSILFGLLFINSGLNKFFNYMPVPEDMPEEIMKVMGAMMQIEFLMPLVAVAEIIGGILIIPAKTRALGAIIIFPIMIGIIFTHFMYEPSGIPLVIILTLVLLWILFENRKKYAALVS